MTVAQINPCDSHFNISTLMTTMASCTTQLTLVCIRSNSVLTHLSAAGSTLMAQRPMARTDFLTKSTSTSVAYLHVHVLHNSKFTIPLCTQCYPIILILSACPNLNCSFSYCTSSLNQTCPYGTNTYPLWGPVISGNI